MGDKTPPHCLPLNAWRTCRPSEQKNGHETHVKASGVNDGSHTTGLDRLATHGCKLSGTNLTEFN